MTLKEWEALQSRTAAENKEWLRRNKVKAQALREMMNTPGWQVQQEIFNELRIFYGESIMKVSVDEPNKLYKIQGAFQAITEYHARLNAVLASSVGEEKTDG